jgi:alkaline phosphatase
MAKNTIIMIGDGMGWEMARAADIYKQIQSAKASNTLINGKNPNDPTLNLSDFYTSGKGTGLNMQTLTGYAIATTYATTVPDANGVYSNGQAAIVGTTGLTSVTNAQPDRPGFVFNPTFNPGTTPTILGLQARIKNILNIAIPTPLIPRLPSTLA